jgi:Protein of unknown function (DUF2786)
MGGGDQKLEVIRKLLAKAEKAATPEEASAYNAKAAQMMARHGVDEAMLAATGVKQDALGERRIALTDPYSQEKAQLAGLIGRALGCRAVRHPGIRPRPDSCRDDLRLRVRLASDRGAVHFLAAAGNPPGGPSTTTGMDGRVDSSVSPDVADWLRLRGLPAAHRRGASGDRPA